MCAVCLYVLLFSWQFHWLLISFTSVSTCNALAQPIVPHFPSPVHSDKNKVWVNRPAGDDARGETHTVDASKRILETICNSNPFLRCLGELIEGTFGIGTRVEILNNPMYGISVSRNCEGKDENPTEANFTLFCLVSDVTEPKLLGFLKTPKNDSERANRYTFLPTLSAFDKEVRRTRQFAQEVHEEGNPMGPSILDVRLTLTGESHPLHQKAFIQEWIGEFDAYQIFLGLEKNELAMLRDNLDAVLCRLEHYSEALKTQSQHELQLKELKDEVVKLQKEFWMRARLRLRLGWSVLVKANHLWSRQIVHCDSHWGNLMLLQTSTKSIRELRRLVQLGLIYVDLPFRHSAAEEVLPSTVALPKEGVPIYLLHPSQIRFVDVAYALKLDSLLTEISSTQSNQDGQSSLRDAERRLQHPCSSYRAERYEDIVELFRGGSDNGGGLSTLFNTTTSYTTYWKRTLELFKAPAHNIHKCRKVLLLKPLNGVAVNALRSLEREAADIDIKFLTILSSMENNEQYRNCVDLREAWDRLPKQDRLDAIHTARPHKSIRQLVPQHTCSFYDIRQGGLKFQRVIEQVALEFPPFAALNLTLS